MTGYYGAVDNWNLGKQAEFEERKPFEIDERKLVDETDSAEKKEEA